MIRIRRILNDVKRLTSYDSFLVGDVKELEAIMSEIEAQYGKLVDDYQAAAIKRSLDERKHDKRRKSG